MRWFRRSRSRWQGVDFLALKPEPLVASLMDDENARVVLLVPRFRTGPLAHWLQPRLRAERAYIRVSLEERGSWLWGQCDGRRTVGDIAAEFRDVFPQDSQEAERRVAMFIYSLVDNGFIRLVNLAHERARAEKAGSP